MARKFGFWALGRLLGPLLSAASEVIQELITELLEKLETAAKATKNTIDDQFVEMLKDV